jgi:hypothetical protein
MEKEENLNMEELLNTHITYAVVLRGPYSDFLKLQDLLSELSESSIIYRKKSLGRLRIITEGEVKEG